MKDGEALKAKWAKQDEQDYENTLKVLLSHDGGRRFLWRLLEYGRVGVQPFTTNALTTAFNCGELNVGQRMLADIMRVDAAGYVRMMQERANEHRERDEQLTNGGADDTDDAYG